MRKIIAELRIVAHDQNKVFFESVSARKLSPSDAQDRYGLQLGKGRAYVEFNVEEPEIRTQYNTELKLDEYFLIGAVELENRDARGFLNF